MAGKLQKLCECEFEGDGVDDLAEGGKEDERS